ncbi:MAG: Smr/MutS family protein [Gammaproteobacteria bacterium]
MPADDGPTFAELIGRVRRLEHDAVETRRQPRPPRRRAREVAESTPLPAWRELHGDGHDQALDGDYHRPGVQHSLLRKLRRGQFALEGELDLHGLTVVQARQRLADFLALTCGQRQRCVRVIHGKGFSSPGMRPVLKPQVRHWLRQDDRVLAYTTAAANDGGSGALYVLLRARRGDR